MSLLAQTAQDCKNAIPICSNTYNQNTNYTGIGSFNELNATNQGCLTTGENNSVWYIINISNAGTFTFTLSPNTNADYDFALYDITDKSCQDIANGLSPIRCNYASLANSSAGGITGLNTSSGTASIGANGPSFSSAVNAYVGQTLLLLVNNNSASITGYTLNFNGSASIADNMPASIKADTLQAGCSGPSFIKILLTENIKCNSLAANGSDFLLSPASATITGAVSQSCSNNSAFTNLITINFSAPLAAGNYTLGIKQGSDGNTLVDNCSNATPINTNYNFSVTTGIGINISAIFGCANQNTGSITANAYNGTAPYLYKINNGIYGTNNIFSNLSSGVYTVYAKDINGCTHDTIISLFPSAPISIDSFVINNISCFGANDGKINIYASGGNPPLNYTLNSNPYQSSNIFNGLAPGNFVLKVKDANGCIVDTLVFVSTPGQLSINSVLNTPASCGNNNGTLVINGFGGSPTYTYKLNNGLFQNGNSFTNLAAGNYTITIKDANGCTATSISNIQQQNGVNITSLNTTNPTCLNATGSISTSVSGGTAPISYSLNGGNFTSSNTFNGLASGTYTITAKDANGCTSSSIAVLSSPSNLKFVNANVNFPTCTSTGSISVQGSGGVAPYTYALNSGPYSSNSNFLNLSSGTYTIHLKDNTGCLHDTIITFPVLSNPNFSNISLNNATCSFPNSGSISLNVINGQAPYNLSINGGPTSTNTSWNNLSAGNYTIVASDANNCSSSTILTINQNNTINFISFSKSNIGCFGTPLGTISANAGNGNSPYTYSLNGGTPQANGNFTINSGGTYTITATDASGCTITSTCIIKSSATVTINSVSKINSPCVNPPTGSISVNGTVSNPPLLYTLIPGGSNTSGNFNNLAPGTYTVRVKDAANCSVTSIVTLLPAPILFFSNLTIVYPPCWGGVGSISALGAGGTSPYQYQLNNGGYGNQNTWNNLPSGGYTVSFKDANGCIKDTFIDLEEPPKIYFNGTLVVNAPCNNAPNGSITVNASNGLAPYTYSINSGPFSNNNIFNNLSSGTYIITIKDANGCESDSSINIIANGNFAIGNIQKTKPSCFGMSDGELNISVSGGTPPYQYSFNGGPFQNSNIITGLSAGNYTITAKDNAGCSVSVITNLTQPSILNINTVITTPPLCFGDANGSILLNANGGTNPKAYAINTSTFSSSNTFSNLSTGTYTLHVKDVNNCTRDSVVILNQPSKVIFSNLNIIHGACNGGNGSVGITANGGINPYTYKKNNGSYVSNSQFNNLAPGNHTLYIKDANGCIADTIITILANAGVSITSINFTSLICANSNAGTITINATSANTPLQYKLNNGAWQNSNNFTSLSAGTYTVYAKDNTNCISDSIIQINNAPLLFFTNFQIIQPLCAGQGNGSVTINAAGGISPYKYKKNNGAYVNSNVFNNLSAGTYTFYIKDSLNCVKDTILSIANPPSIAVQSINILQPLCSSATNGTIGINITGGTSPYLYAINTSLFTTNNIFNNLAQGTYTIHISDANNCTLDTVVQLNAGPYMQFNNITIQNVSCQGGNNGQISISTSGGTAPYNYSINAIPNGTSGNFSNLSIGTYTIQVTDNIGCQKDTILSISQPSSTVHPILLSNVGNKCKGDSAGILQMSASGGASPYQYSITGISYQSSNSFAGLAAGNYTIYVKDANGCISDTILHISEPDTSVQLLLVQIQHQSCKGVNDGSIKVSSQYGFEPYTFYLNGAIQNLDTFYNNLAPGEYIVEVFDSIGCKSTGKYIVNSSSIEPIIFIDSLKDIVCNGGKDGYLEWHASSPYPPYIYSFNASAYTSVNSANNLSQGIYTIEVLDNKGCYADTTVQLIAENFLELSVNSYPASCGGIGNDGAAKAIVIGGKQPYNFTWSALPMLNKDTNFNLKYGTYALIVTDANLCSDTTEFSIDYEPCCVVVLPNAFTPNADGRNDIYRMIKQGQVKLEYFSIYNRWGMRVFHTEDLNGAWNGQFKNQDCEIGSYYFIVVYTCGINNEKIIYKGDVSLIR